MMNLSFVIIACASNLIIFALANEKWDYGLNGPKTWPDNFPTCDGYSQSPVNIDSAYYNNELKPIKLYNYSKTLNQPMLTNNGHSAQLSAKNANGEITGAFLKNHYTFLQLHFHWGSNNEKGSEHLFDGESYPMELHLVHLNNKYTLSDALNYDDGLAVLGVLFEIAEKPNSNLTAIIKALGNIKNKNEVTNITSSINLGSLLPEDKSYYTYCGSLTTPLCDEVVSWIVFSQTVPISIKQIKEFRQLRFGDQNSPNMVNNFRPPQPLNERIIYQYMED